MGTETYFGIPKISSDCATPLNSAMVLPRFATSSASMMKKVVRTPNRSRTRSESPLPVTTAMRAHISCTRMSARVMGMRVQSSE